MCSGQFDDMPTFVNQGGSDSNTLQSKAPGQWSDSIGAYCTAWDAGIDIEWCFVKKDIVCHGNRNVWLPQAYMTTQGQKFWRSRGPCTEHVESRSEYVLEGLRVMIWPLKVAFLLGVFLLVVSGCGLLFYHRPQRTSSTWTASKASV